MMPVSIPGSPRADLWMRPTMRCRRKLLQPHRSFSGQFGFDFLFEQQLFCYEIPNQVTFATVHSRGRRRAGNSLTEVKLNQASLAESWMTDSSMPVAIFQN